MKKPLLATAALLWVATAAPAQLSPRVYTDALTPARDALDRLNLRAAWSAYVPMDGRRDGLLTVQLAPNPVKKTLELLVQTRSGLLVALDADSGQTLWTSRVGNSYRPTKPAAFNGDSVFVIRDVELYALDRDNGRVRWHSDLVSGATSPPAADDTRLYVGISGSGLTAFALPPAGGARSEEAPPAPVDAVRVLKKALDAATVGVAPTEIRKAIRRLRFHVDPLFNYPRGTRVEQAPLLAGNRLLITESGGAVLGAAADEPAILSRITTSGDIAVAAGQHETTAYVAGGDLTLHAVDIRTGLPVWRYPVAAAMPYAPAATDQDVYVTATPGGLIRLDRAAGVEAWRNADAGQFLAANPKFVYAFDRSGRLLVLDRARGTTLSTYPAARDFVFPVPNDWTDRVFLAANNGLLVCLHDKEYGRAVAVKKMPVREAPPPAKPGVKKDAGDEKKGL